MGKQPTFPIKISWKFIQNKEKEYGKKYGHLRP